MAISPPSDIVLDVVRAADPARHAAALDKLGNAGAAQGAGFVEVLSRTGDPAIDFAANLYRATGRTEASEPPVRQAPRAQEQTVDRPASKAFRQFEAFFLQNFIELMMPKNSEAVFGRGTAGSVWKSLLAENMAEQLARNGGVGIAERLQGASWNESAAKPKLASFESTGSASQWASQLPSIDREFLKSMRSDAAVSDTAPIPDTTGLNENAESADGI